MTPCEKLGYKVGDKFEVINETWSGVVNQADVLTLVEDDGTYIPGFSGSSAKRFEERCYCCLSRLEKIEPPKTLDDVFANSGGTGIDFSPGHNNGEKIIDKVNPSHYKQGNIECIDAIEAMLSHEEFIGFLRGNMMKYNWRLYGKDCAEMNTEKCEWYTNKLKEVLSNETK